MLERKLATIEILKLFCYFAKSIHSPIQIIKWPQVYKSKHIGMQTDSTNICVQQVQPLNVLTPTYSTVNCQWYYDKVEVISNDSNSATKW